ncbi:Ig-like domain-containing protein, partial [Flavobacterium noncentrifugens]
VTGVAGGTSTITYTNAAGCKITQSITVSPIPTITGTFVVCAGSTTALTGSGTPATSNPWVSSNTTVATIDNLGVVTGVTAGTSTITYTNLAGCKISQSITVNALPTITGTFAVCTGLTTALTGSGTPATASPWVSSNTTVATVDNLGVVTGVIGGTSIITYTNADGCKISQSITVNALPTITGTFAVCIGSTTTLTGSGTPATASPWVSANTAVATISNTGMVTGVSAGTSLITYTNAAGCIITQIITVNALPTITGTLNVCVGLTTTLIGSATPATLSPWISATPAIATVSNTGVVTGVSGGTVLITYTNSNGCKTTATVNVIAAPVITGILNVCIGSTTTLTGSGTPATTSPWISANTAAATITNAGVVTGVSAGTSLITYTNSNGCIITATVVVNPLPTITGTLNVCAGLTTALTGSGSPATPGAWISANTAVATVSNTGVVTGVSVGSTLITYTNSNGCKITATVIVNALPTITGTLNVCEGLTTTLIGSGTPALTNAWISSNPGVATISSTGVVNGISAGTTVITYTNSNGCIKMETISVSAPPTITGMLNVCIGSTTILSGSATAATVSPWVSSAPTVATVGNTGIVTGVSAGTTVITYKNANGCTITATITVNAIPTVTGTLSVCEGSQTQLTGSATASAVNPWISSNPSVATVDNVGLVTGVKAGTVTITYTNSNGCIKTATVVVNPLPVVNLPQDEFICVDPSGIVISRANLTTGLTGPYTFKWFDAAGEILGETASSYSAGAAGDYTVEVTNTVTGCVNTGSATVTASFAPVSATYEVSNYFSETQLVTINVLPVGDYLYQVDNGAFQSSNQFYNLSSGYHDVVIKDRVGCGSIPISDIRIIAFPKFFTPNNDGYNDRWNIPDLSDQNGSKILIFDRYGKLMKEISPKGAGWDGMFNGNPAPADDYWFKVFFIEQGSSKEFNAHFALKR